MAESGTFYLEIITPERQFYIGTAEALVIPAVDGEMGIYPGHEPVVTAIEPGELRYKTEGKWEPAAVGAGFAEVKPDYVILLVGFAEHPEEIDRRRAEAAKKRAEERLRQIGRAHVRTPVTTPHLVCPGPGHGQTENPPLSPSPGWGKWPIACF